MIRLVAAILLMILGGASSGCAGRAAPDDNYVRLVEQLGHQALATAWQDEDVRRLLGPRQNRIRSEQRRWAATLVALGHPAAPPDALHNWLSQNAAMRGGAELFGRIGDPQLLTRLAASPNWDNLLRTTPLHTALDQALANGVITGYDLRARGVYDKVPPERSLIYSHSDPQHLQQLVSVLAAHSLRGALQLTPKVSGFLHRAEWGEPGPHVVTLDSGVRVVQGRELAVLFQFDTAAERSRFHQLVRQYAKRDSEDEQGLIAGSWWQPFYYSVTPVAEFTPIHLIVVEHQDVEATLTVVAERSHALRASLAELPGEIRLERIWVNPAFHRYLLGDFR